LGVERLRSWQVVVAPQIFTADKIRKRLEKSLAGAAEKTTPAQFPGLVVELLVTEGASWSCPMGCIDQLKAGCETFGVDLKACEILFLGDGR
jgi:hypothetical protein